MNIGFIRKIRQGVLLACTAIFVVGFQTSALAQITNIDRAEKLSQTTGRPILAIVASDTSEKTKGLIRKFRSDGSTRKYIGKFVFLRVSTQTEAYQTWRSKHGSPGASFPEMFIVRADGRKIY